MIDGNPNHILVEPAEEEEFESASHMSLFIYSHVIVKASVQSWICMVDTNGRVPVCHFRRESVAQFDQAIDLKWDEVVRDAYPFFQI